MKRHLQAHTDQAKAGLRVPASAILNFCDTYGVRPARPCHTATTWYGATMTPAYRHAGHTRSHTSHTFGLAGSGTIRTRAQAYPRTIVWALRVHLSLWALLIHVHA